MSIVPGVLVAVTAFVAMEPVTAASHRWIMHGVGRRLHRSHHRRRGSGRWEANDWFPVMFSAIVMLAIWVGFNREGFAALLPAAVGVTAYGAAYALVHDVYIHGRLRRRTDGSLYRSTRVDVDLLERLADAHRVHHRYGEAPYGMLLPLVPARLRDRAARHPDRAARHPDLMRS